MISEELRKKFIDFFSEKGHKELPAASLIPENDPSVLFTTAGMQQLKPFYLKPETAPAKNLVTIQPCFRTSDIDEVGDETHLTFFEMLGNFSFGGYFKKEAIEWGYEFLTETLNIDKEKIWCSVFAGDEKNPRDDASAEILDEMGLKYKEHPREDNFWGPTGEEGPCGPTVEFYVNEIEVWNLVFNEYFKATDESYRKLESSGVDTGMGLERMLVVLNNAENVYHTDVFKTLHDELHQFNIKKEPVLERIILDHLKAATFAINGGILPSNKDRGYIVRRLIRRAVVKGLNLGINENFTAKIGQKVIETYSNYEIKKSVLEELEKEEQKFRNTLRQGLKYFENKKELSGRDLFDLYQTYGLPLEITLEEARGLGIIIQQDAQSEFKKLLKEHQNQSRTASVGMFKGGLVGETGKTIQYHTATHLLLKSLQIILGHDVHQRGSNINDERLRFDFSYPEALASKEIKQIEDLVNVKIAEKLPVVRKEMTFEEAKALGAEAQFEDKYSKHDKLTLYSIGDFSHELCGGPHVKNTGELGKFKIIKEESSSSGVRRIKAILE